MKKFFSLVSISLVVISAWSQTTYTWNTAGGSWATSTNWTPTRSTPATNDILVFSNGGTKTITNVPTQTIGALLISNNSNITLDASGGPGKILTIGNVTGTDLSIASGSSLTNTGSLDGITLSASSTADISGTFNVDVNSTFNTDAVGIVTTVAGTINNFGTVTCTNATRLLFSAGGTYIHAVNGGTIPTATWNSASNCNITGITSTVPGGLSQSFGNYTWNSSGHSATINLNSALTTINGNFTINQAGNVGGMFITDPLVLSNNTNLTLNIGGDLTISNTGAAAWTVMTIGTAAVTINVGGNFNISNTNTFFDYNIGTTQNSALVVNVSGNYTQTNGFLDWAFTPTTGSIASELRIGGNFSHSGSALISTSIAETGSTVPNGKIVFNKAGVQTISVATTTNISYTNYDVNSGSTLELLSNLYLFSSNTPRWGGNFVVKSGAVFDAGTFQLQCVQPSGVNNVFTLGTGAGMITANANGIQNGLTGSVYDIIATRTFSSGANYTYDGTAVQNTGIFTTTPTANQVNNLTVNNSAGRFTTGLTLQQPIAVASACTFTQGVITSSATNLLTFNAGSSAVGANNNLNPSFVHGPVLKKGNTDFEFPVGNTATGLIPIAISGLSASSDFLAEYKRMPASSLGPITAPGLDHVSRCEYWSLDRTGAATANVTLYWNNFSNCNFPITIQNPNLATLYVSHFNGTSWDTYGRNSLTGTPPSGTVTWNNIGTFSPFALGTTDPQNFPLKVKLGDIKAYQLGNTIKVEWSNLTESDVINYEVERSANGIGFFSVGQQLPRSNSNDRQDYSLLDYSPLPGANFYRIRVLEQNGRITYSKIVKVEMGATSSQGFKIYPNPVLDKIVTVTINGWEKGQYSVRVFNSSGQHVFTTNWQHTGGSASRTVELPGSLSPGYYLLEITGAGKKLTSKFVIQ